jgi:hypothetical protein
MISKPINKNPKDINDLCPICLDNLDNSEPLDYCKYSCGKAIHSECFKMWSKKFNNKCLYCKKPWNNIESEYINLKS